MKNSSTVTPTDTQEIEKVEAVAGNRKVAYYLNYTIWKQWSSDASATQVTDPSDVIYLKTVVPEDVRSAYNNLKVVRYHEGVATLITPESYDPATGELIFGSNQFSDFAIVGTYNPNTGIGSSNGLWAVAALVVCAGALVLISFKKRESVQ